MKVVCKPRRCGKTYDLMTNYFLKSNDWLLVADQQEKQRLVNQFELERKDSERILPWSIAKERLAGSMGAVLIDNVDLFLETYFHRPIKVMSVTGRESR